MAACRNKKSWGLGRASGWGTEYGPPAAARRGVVMRVHHGIIAQVGATAVAIQVIG